MCRHQRILPFTISSAALLDNVVVAHAVMQPSERAKDTGKRIFWTEGDASASKPVGNAKLRKVNGLCIIMIHELRFDGELSRSKGLRT